MKFEYCSCSSARRATQLDIVPKIPEMKEDGLTLLLLRVNFLLARHLGRLGDVVPHRELESEMRCGAAVQCLAGSGTVAIVGYRGIIIRHEAYLCLY